MTAELKTCPHDVADFCQYTSEQLWADAQHPGSGSDGALLLTEVLHEHRQAWFAEHRDEIRAYASQRLGESVGDARATSDWGKVLELVAAR